jgi:hypothetical protein
VDAVGIATRGVGRCNGKGITILTPVAPVVHRPGLLSNEVASLLARRRVRPGKAAIVGVFVVVAWAKAIGVVGIDQVVPIVVEAIATLVDLALARGDLTAMHRHSAVSTIERATAGPRAGRKISPEFDWL